MDIQIASVRKKKIDVRYLAWSIQSERQTAIRRKGTITQYSC